MLSPTEEQELLSLLEAEAQDQATNLFASYFPERGPTRRGLYPKHLEFFQAGVAHRERLLLAANRVGKTMASLYELVAHLTGDYPLWWRGRRFGHPIRAWLAGDTAKTTRDILQDKLLGPPGAFGTGMLPRVALLKTSPKYGLPDAVELVRVRHASGGDSLLQLKSYDQGRQAFQGTEQHYIALDEEPPLGVYTECLLRTMTTHGAVVLTFTPLLGLSDTVLQFLPDGQLPAGDQTGSKYVVGASWDDVPHLDEATKGELLAAMPPHQRDARTRGLPLLGAGVIYPVPEDDYLVEDFALPAHWRRAYGLDVGWNRTAGLWGAYDPDTDTWSLYSEHYRGQAEPSVHAAAVRGRGEWIAGVIDPAARGRGQMDGSQLLQGYLDLGLDLTPAENAVEAGIYQVWERLSTGRLKVFRSLHNLRKELRLYRRDEKGRVVKTDDHLMDAMRYLVMSGADVARAVPVKAEPEPDEWYTVGSGNTQWMR